MRSLWIVVLALASLPLWAGHGHSLSLWTQIGVGTVACLSYQWLWGQGGMLSFGQAIYTGAGAYVAIHLMRGIALGWPVPMVLVPLLAALATGGLAWALGGISTRRSGAPLAMITLGLGELMWALAPIFPDWFGGEAGWSADRTAGTPVLGWSGQTPAQMYVLVLVYLGVCLWGLHSLQGTPLGLYLRAAREQGSRLAHIGPDPHRVRWMAFVIAGAVAGLAGGLSALVFEIVTPEAFNPVRSGELLVFTVLGGSRHLAGAVVGGALLVLAHTSLARWTPASGLYLGVLFMVLVMHAPQGLAGLVAKHWAQWRTGALARPPWSALWPTLLRLGMAAGAWLGAGVLVEMAYQHQTLSTSGSLLALPGVMLDITQLAHWAGVAAWTLVCSLIWWLSRSGGHAPGSSA